MAVLSRPTHGNAWSSAPATAAPPRSVWLALWAITLWTVGYQLACTVIPSLASWVIYSDVATDVAFWIGALLIIWFGLRGDRAWLLIGLGTLCWPAGDMYWELELSHLPTPPVPSWSDAGYLMLYPFWLTGILWLVRRRTPAPSRTMVADALTASLAVAALSAAVVVHPVLVHATGSDLSIATDLAYPLGDMAVVGLIVSATVLGGRRFDRSWALLAAAGVVFWVADSFYVVADATGTYSLHSWYNPLWNWAPVLAAWAAWLPQRRTTYGEPRRPATGQIALPLLFGCGALAILIWSSFDYLGVIAIVLGALALLVVLWRLALTWRENEFLLRASRDQALTDPLTGLNNRRSLLARLERQIPAPGSGEELLLITFDLDGFKAYNDDFGHPAGDALLQRLGGKLVEHLADAGTAYRMGGDEFCALIPLDGTADPEVVALSASVALSEQGEGFSIGCSYGSILMPSEAADITTALGLADERMYAQKRGSRLSASRQSRDVLLRALAEQRPDLRDHLQDVADLALAVAQKFALSAREIEQIQLAGELHDVGKVAIPDAILDKPGPLDDTEWEYVKSHSVIGERIIAAAPALRGVATIVRSCHENFDGTGYPDQLAGEAIPLGARIIAVCDAFDAMTTDRAYRKAMGVGEAVAELKRCAGSQFDPEVVERFARAVAPERERERESTAGAPVPVVASA